MDNPTYTLSNIPKIIHQTWKTKDVPDKWKKSENEWKRLHPDWIYHLWTDEEIREHVKSHHPTLLEIHDNYPYPIQKADMIRYLILYDYGGLYSDLDLYPTKNIESYLDQSLDYVVYSANSNCYTNALMIGKKHSKNFYEVIQELYKPVPWYGIGKHLHVMTSTGPLMFHRVMTKTKYPYAILPQTLFNPYAIEDSLDEDKGDVFIRTLEGSSWHGYDSKMINHIIKNRQIYIVVSIIMIIMIFMLIIYLIVKTYKNKGLVKRLKEVCGFQCSNIK